MRAVAHRPNAWTPVDGGGGGGEGEKGQELGGHRWKGKTNERGHKRQQRDGPMKRMALRMKELKLQPAALMLASAPAPRFFWDRQQNRMASPTMICRRQTQLNQSSTYDTGLIGPVILTGFSSSVSLLPPGFHISSCTDLRSRKSSIMTRHLMPSIFPVALYKGLFTHSDIQSYTNGGCCHTQSCHPQWKHLQKHVNSENGL